MNTPVSEDTLQQIKAAIFARRKIQAIKLLRVATNLGLAEAKEWVENLSAELESKEPEKFTAAKSGCSTAVFLALGLATLIAGVSWL